MQPKHLIILGLLLLLLSAGVYAISADEAVALVQTKNNYLMPSESAVVLNQMITYNNQKYIVVAAKNNDTITAYIPIKSSDGNIASSDIEIREITKTAIIYTKMTELYSGPLSTTWLFSYSTKNYFYSLQSDFSNLKGGVITVQTELSKLGTDAGTLTQLADDTQSKLESLATESKNLGDQIEEGRKIEEQFLSTPDTSKVTAYEKSYADLFDALDSYKKDYAAITTNLTQLNQGIGALETNKITIDQKRSLQAVLTTPINARRLDTIFSQSDQLRTLVESVFTESKKTDNFSATLNTRELRNSAWKIMYGPNDTLQKLNSSFDTLAKAAEGILSTDNVDLWENQDSVTALTGHWNSAKTKFDTAEYEKAKDFAQKAANDAKQILQSGVKQPVELDYQDLIIKGIAGLVILIIAVFGYQTFFRKKKEEGEDYNEP